jgi:hypothetical protein
MTGDLPALEAVKRDVQRNIANARLRAFEDACFSVGEVQGVGDRRIEIIDFLQNVAEANGLIRAHGEGLIHLMIVAGLRGDT